MLAAERVPALQRMNAVTMRPNLLPSIAGLSAEIQDGLNALALATEEDHAPYFQDTYLSNVKSIIRDALKGAKFTLDDMLISEEEISGLTRIVRMCENDVEGARSLLDKKDALASYYLAFERLRYAIAIGFGRKMDGEMKIAQIRSAARTRA
jgi:hypothetical protein